MLFGVRRRLSTEDDFFTEGYMERNNDFKTVVLPSPSEQTVCGTSTSNFPCSVYLCNQSFSSITKLENHIYYCHRYQCSQCHKSFPSDHLLSIHLSERHDNYFRIMAKKLPSFVCYVEDCKSVFKNLNDRKVHMINVHQFPESFEFDSKERHKRNCKGFFLAIVNSRYLSQT